MAHPSPAIVLLGAQRRAPSLATALAALGVEGQIALITCGWQEREPEDEELRAHLGMPAVNLELYRRTDEIAKADPDLRAAHRRKQNILRHKQDFYRIRLEHEIEAGHVIAQRQAPEEVLRDERAATTGALRLLDDYHLGECAKVEREFHETWTPRDRPSMRPHMDELAEIVDRSAAVAIAGGHVATLLNRMRLFGLGSLLDGKTILAWAAGAMAISRRVVLFHDSPPQGPGAAQVLDHGLALCPGVIPLPHPETRLRLDDPDRVSRLVTRFAPAHCLALPASAHITYRDGCFRQPVGVQQLMPDGTCHDIGPNEELA